MKTPNPLELQRFKGNNLTKPLPDTLYQVGVYAMWLGLLLDTIETRQGEGDAFLVEGVAFCIAGVAFFRGVMHWGEACFT